MTLQQISEKIGVDDEIIDINFAGKTHLYMKCISLFTKYDFIFEIENAIKAKNYKIVENKAHSLKGISANLGFKELNKISTEIVNTIRNNKYEYINNFFKYLKIEYERIIDIIKKI